MDRVSHGSQENVAFSRIGPLRVPHTQPAAYICALSRDCGVPKETSPLLTARDLIGVILALPHCLQTQKR